jgi:hypothetical protein
MERENTTPYTCRRWIERNLCIMSTTGGDCVDLPLLHVHAYSAFLRKGTASRLGLLTLHPLRRCGCGYLHAFDVDLIRALSHDNVPTLSDFGPIQPR